MGELYPARGDVQRRAIQARWAGYERCDDCRALPGMPCRDREPYHSRVADRPCPGRTKTSTGGEAA